MLIADWDDLTGKDYWFLSKLEELKSTNPLFKCSVFAIPTQCTKELLRSVPYWVQVCVHGHDHYSNYECNNWTYSGTCVMLKAFEESQFYTRIFKAPGWQISKEAREAIRDAGWILADNPNYKQNRLPGERIYDFTEYGDNAWHGHVQDVCGNGLLETWDRLVERVRTETDFKFISEVIK